MKKIYIKLVNLYILQCFADNWFSWKRHFQGQLSRSWICIWL